MNAVTRRSPEPFTRNSGPGPARLLEARLLALHEALSAEELWKAVERLMTVALPADTYNFFLNVPELDRPQVMFTTSRFMKDLPPEELERALKASRAISYLAANPGIRVMTFDHVFSVRSNFLRSSYYREFCEPNGWSYSVGMPLWEGSRMIGFLAALRTVAEGDFRPRELEIAQRIHPQINTAASRVLRASKEKSVRLSFQSLFRDQNRAVVLLNWEGEVVFTSRAAREYLLKWRDGPAAPRTFAYNGKRGLPRKIEHGIRRLRARYVEDMRAGSRNPAIPGETVPHSSQESLRAEIRLLMTGLSALVMPSILVEFVEESASQVEKRTSPELIRRLTPREREVVALLCRGLNNAEIGQTLGRTVGSVKQQLSVIYDKLNVPSRSKLMALCREVR